MEGEFLIWLWHGPTNDLIRIGINSDVLRNSISNGEHDTIRYWSRREDYTDEQPIDAAREVADYSGTTPNYVTNQAKTNRLAYLLTSPRRMMFTKSDVDQWMASWKKVEATAR